MKRAKCLFLTLVLILSCFTILAPANIASADSVTYEHVPSGSGDDIKIYTAVFYPKNAYGTSDTSWNPKVKDSNGTNYNALCLCPNLYTPGAGKPQGYDINDMLDEILRNKLTSIYLHNTYMMSVSEIAILSGTEGYNSLSVYGVKDTEGNTPELPVTDDIFARLARSAAQRAAWKTVESLYAGTPQEFYVDWQGHSTVITDTYLNIEWKDAKGVKQSVRLGRTGDNAAVLEMYDKLYEFYCNLMPYAQLSESDFELEFDAPIYDDITNSFLVPVRYKLNATTFGAENDVILDIEVDGSPVTFGLPVPDGVWTKIFVPVSSATTYKITINQDVAFGDYEGIYLTAWDKDKDVAHQPLFLAVGGPLEKEWVVQVDGEPDSAEAVLFANKKLTGRNLEDAEFSFGLYEADSTYTENDTPIQTVKNNAAGLIEFNPIVYGVGDVGTHYYVIKEIKGSDSKITYSTQEIGVRVEVSIGSDAKLNAAVTYVVNGQDSKLPGTIENTYTTTKKDPPKTGDESNITLLLVVMCASASLAVVQLKRRKAARK